MANLHKFEALDRSPAYTPLNDYETYRSKFPPEKFAHNEELRNAALATDQMERALALVRQIAVMQTSMEGYVENYRWDTVIVEARKVVDKH